MSSVIQTLAGLEVETRWMWRADLDQVTAIERECFESAWSRQDFLNCLCSRYSCGYVALVTDAALGERVAGYLVHTTCGRCAEINNLAVAPEFRRRGIASALVRHKWSATWSQMPRVVRADVRETNTGAQLFFRAANFRCRTILADVYDESDELAYRFVWSGNQEISDFGLGIAD